MLCEGLTTNTHSPSCKSNCVCVFMLVRYELTAQTTELSLACPASAERLCRSGSNKQDKQDRDGASWRTGRDVSVCVIGKRGWGGRLCFIYVGGVIWSRSTKCMFDLHLVLFMWKCLPQTNRRSSRGGTVHGGNISVLSP